MKAMILAAGYGKRLRPLTETTPKPLLPVGGKPLMQHHIERLAAAGIRDLVINTSWLAEQIEDYFADGTEFGVSIDWSRESQPLETGGGIAHALPLLDDQPFLLINGDIWTDFPIQSIAAKELPSDRDGWLLLVDNPEHNPRGDFGLIDGQLVSEARQKYTFSGVSLLRPQLFSRADRSNACFPLRDILRPAIDGGRISGEIYNGQWCDVGTVERYRQIDSQLNQ